MVKIPALLIAALLVLEPSITKRCAKVVEEGCEFCAIGQRVSVPRGNVFPGIGV
jgi:hypothetical protein